MTFAPLPEEESDIAQPESRPEEQGVVQFKKKKGNKRTFRKRAAE